MKRLTDYYRDPLTGARHRPWRGWLGWAAAIAVWLSLWLWSLTLPTTGRGTRQPADAAPPRATARSLTTS